MFLFGFFYLFVTYCSLCNSCSRKWLSCNLPLMNLFPIISTYLRRSSRPNLVWLEGWNVLSSVSIHPPLPQVLKLINSQKIWTPRAKKLGNEVKTVGIGRSPIFIVRFRVAFVEAKKRPGEKNIRWSSRTYTKGGVGPYGMCHVTTVRSWWLRKEEEIDFDLWLKHLSSSRFSFILYPLKHL